MEKSDWAAIFGFGFIFSLGCLLILSGLVSMGLWASILFGILITIEAPAWLWVLFWIYIPFSLVLFGVSSLIQGVYKIMSKKD